MRELCKWKGVNIITAEVCPDHVQMLIEIPTKMSISSFMGFLKGKNNVMNMNTVKFKYRNRQFWCRGYYVDTAGKNAEMIRNYIDEQLKEDHLAEKLTIDKINPFTDSKK